MAIDDKKKAYSWGFGGYGRLGHSEPKDEMQPRLIKYFDVQRSGVKHVACGHAFSIAINEFGMRLGFLLQIVMYIYFLSIPHDNC